MRSCNCLWRVRRVGHRAGAAGACRQAAQAPEAAQHEEGAGQVQNNLLQVALRVRPQQRAGRVHHRPPPLQGGHTPRTTG